MTDLIKSTFYDYDDFYREFQNKYLSYKNNDLQLRSKITLNNNSLFISKMKLNTNSSNSKSLFTRNAYFSFLFKSIKENFEIETNSNEDLKLYNFNSFSVSNSVLLSYMINSSILSFNNKSAISLSYKNLLFSFGFENFSSLFKKNEDSLIFFSGRLYGKSVNSNKTSINIKADYNIYSSYLNMIKFFIKNSDNDFKSLLEININRKKIDEMMYDNSLCFSYKFLKKLNDWKFGASILHDIDSQRVVSDMIIQKRMDKDTVIKTRFTNERNIFIGYSKRFSDNISINIVNKIQLLCEKNNNLGLKHWFDYRFGFSIQFEY